MTGGFLNREVTIDRGDATSLQIQLASGAALGTPGGAGRLRGDGAHLPSLDLPTELLPQLMGSGFDH
jgi:hypothetical protein